MAALAPVRERPEPIEPVRGAVPADLAPRPPGRVIAAVDRIEAGPSTAGRRARSGPERAAALGRSGYSDEAPGALSRARRVSSHIQVKNGSLLTADAVLRACMSRTGRRLGHFFRLAEPSSYAHGGPSLRPDGGVLLEHQWLGSDRLRRVPCTHRRPFRYSICCRSGPDGSERACSARSPRDKDLPRRRPFVERAAGPTARQGFAAAPSALSGLERLPAPSHQLR